LPTILSPASSGTEFEFLHIDVNIKGDAKLFDNGFRTGDDEL